MICDNCKADVDSLRYAAGCPKALCRKCYSKGPCIEIRHVHGYVDAMAAAGSWIELQTLAKEYRREFPDQKRDDQEPKR